MKSHGGHADSKLAANILVDNGQSYLVWSERTKTKLKKNPMHVNPASAVKMFDRRFVRVRQMRQK